MPKNLRNKHTMMYVYNMSRKPKDDLKGFLFIADHIVRIGRPPSFEAIRRELDYGSKRSVQLLLDRLVAAKRITYINSVIDIVHKADIIVDARTVNVPILAEVPCGPLEEAIEDAKGWVKVSITVAKAGSKYFIVRGKGNSMNLAGIDSGDLMLIRQQASADNNDIVLALVDGAATVQRFRREKEFIVLMPESDDPDNMPMIFTSSFSIQGKVITRLPDPY
ncbi:MAG: S24 family peptidase [Pyrinomonadaceae bacterium]